MEYECGKCLPSDCRGNPAYFDPDCPVHGTKKIRRNRNNVSKNVSGTEKVDIEELRSAIRFFKNLEQDLAQLDYDPLSPKRYTEHSAMMYGKILCQALMRCNPDFLSEKG